LIIRLGQHDRKENEKNYKVVLKKTIKRIRMKTKIPNKFYFLLKGEIEIKNEFDKRTVKKLKQSKE
jgi:hypothetical protein